MRKRMRKRKRKRKKEKNKDREWRFCKRLFFLLLAPGSALEKFATTVNAGNKPTKVNWTFSWPSAFDILWIFF
jgi:hypothetical protein